MNVVVCLDSFKGTMDAPSACAAVVAGLRSAGDALNIVQLPLADGGEGTGAALQQALGGEWIPLTVTGPTPGRPVEAAFLWLPARRTAVVEMASASGLVLVPEGERNPLNTTTYGTGELLRAAADHGAENLVLTIGGSATTDGGIGAASALGWKFLDSQGNPVIHGGERVSDIRTIVHSPAPLLPPLRVLCDVTNPLTGPMGAAAVYGPQKGADPAMVALLDKGLKHLAGLVREQLGLEVDYVEGAGAAGGMGAASLAFFGGELVRGIDAILDLVEADAAFETADWVVTGEGGFDSQSLQGKVVQGVTERALAKGAKVAVIAGTVTLPEADWRAAGIDRVLSLAALSGSVEAAMSDPARWLADAGTRLAAVFRARF